MNTIYQVFAKLKRIGVVSNPTKLSAVAPSRYMIALCMLIVFGMVITVSAEQFVYPSKGQTKEQQQKDEMECHEWAKEQTGVDPEQLAKEASTGEVYQKHHKALKGAVVGSLIGLAAGSLGGVAGEGAAIGAAIGTVGGAIKARADLDTQHKVYESAHAEQRAKLQRYDKAYGVCLQGRGYSVK